MGTQSISCTTCVSNSYRREKTGPRVPFETVSSRMVRASSRSLLLSLAYHRPSRVSLTSCWRIAYESLAHRPSIYRVSFAYRHAMSALRSRSLDSPAYRLRIERVSLAHRSRVLRISLRITRVSFAYHRTARASLAHRSRIVYRPFAYNST